MSKYFSTLLLVIISAWFLYAFTGCGWRSEPTASDQQSSAVQTKASAPTAGATCTITLWNIYGGDQTSFDQAQQLLAQIKKETSWSDLHIVRTDQDTKICRGYFESFSSNKAQRTLREVRSYTNSQGQRPFQQATFAALPGEENKPIIAGPPEWDLRRAPGNATLCINVLTTDGNPTAAAVKEVKKLREQNIEAWYYHGQYRSGVYVGHFDAGYESVATGKTASGESITRLKFVTHDPEFAILRKKFPFYRIDGQRLEYTIGKGKAYESSRLVPIPRPGEELLDSEVGL